MCAKIEGVKIPEEKLPLTPLSEHLDINMDENNIKTDTNLVVLIGKLRSTFQDPDICAEGLLIFIIDQQRSVGIIV